MSPSRLSYPAVVLPLASRHGGIFMKYQMFNQTNPAFGTNYEQSPRDVLVLATDASLDCDGAVKAFGHPVGMTP